MNKTIPTTNVVASPLISVPARRTFSSWGEARSLEYMTRNFWLYEEGRGVSRNQRAAAEILVEDQTYGLFHRSQTHDLTELERSRRLLIARFVKRPEIFGFRHHNTDKITQRLHWQMYGSLRDLVYGSFNYKNRTQGVRVSLKWPWETVRADALYVRAEEFTDWFVLDVDNHRPTPDSTAAHLLLVQRLVTLMPDIVRTFHARSVFYDYRQDAPGGIHIWVLLRDERQTARLHQRVREFLERHSDPVLDKELVRTGLRRMGCIEILPTQGNLIRLFGTYDRRVFTTTELQPRQGWFDAKALLGHIKGKATIGNPCRRYGELARAGLANAPMPHRPSSATIDQRVAEVTVARPRRRDNYFAYLVDACLNGVSEADVLYQAYLSPLARALYYRDFHDDPRKRDLVIQTLMEWLENKHNDLVSRITDGNRRNLVAVLRHIVRHMDATPQETKDFWAKVRVNDATYPNQRISLVACMTTKLISPIPVTKDTLGQVRDLLKGYTYKLKVSSPSSASPNSPPPALPPAVEARLRDHLSRATSRGGKQHQRIVDFAARLLHEIGLNGEIRLPWKRINTLAGLQSGRKHADRYKKILVGAGILHPWKNTGVPKVRATLYRLTDWVLKEMQP